jgi:glycerol-3-phosphate dehydrogenase
VEVTGALKEGDRVVGVQARDRLTEEPFEVSSRVVANMTGPWAGLVAAALGGKRGAPRMRFAKGVHIVTGSLTRDVAVALRSGEGARAWARRGSRHIFIMPWRGRSLIGATNTPFSDVPDRVAPTVADARRLIDDLKAAYPGREVMQDDVRYAFAGLYPVFGGGHPRSGGYEAATRSLIVDHQARDGVRGLITAVAVKYTTARRVAERVVDRVFNKLGHPAPEARTATTPVPGGELEDPDRFITEAVNARPGVLMPEDVQRLVAIYGVGYERLASYVRKEPGCAERLSADAPMLRVEVLHAVREEMAVRLGDVAFRRTGLATLGDPGTPCLNRIADIMGAELGWTAERRAAEVAMVRSALPAVTGDLRE